MNLYNKNYNLIDKIIKINIVTIISFCLINSSFAEQKNNKTDNTQKIEQQITKLKERLLKMQKEIAIQVKKNKSLKENIKKLSKEKKKKGQHHEYSLEEKQAMSSNIYPQGGNPKAITKKIIKDKKKKVKTSSKQKIPENIENNKENETSLDDNVTNDFTSNTGGGFYGQGSYQRLQQYLKMTFLPNHDAIFTYSYNPNDISVVFNIGENFTITQTNQSSTDRLTFKNISICDNNYSNCGAEIVAINSKFYISNDYLKQNQSKLKPVNITINNNSYKAPVFYIKAKDRLDKIHNYNISFPTTSLSCKDNNGNIDCKLARSITQNINL